MTTLFEIFAATLNFLFTNLGGFLGLVVFGVALLVFSGCVFFAAEKADKYLYIHGHKFKPYMRKKLGMKRKVLNLG